MDYKALLYSILITAIALVLAILALIYPIMGLVGAAIFVFGIMSASLYVILSAP